MSLILITREVRQRALKGNMLGGEEAQNGGQPTYPFYSYMTLAALNIVLSVTATSGNILILVALPKISSLFPTSKFLYRCLAFTDLCVGVISQPAYVTFLIKLYSEGEKLWDLTSPTSVFVNVASLMFCGVSLSTLSAISVDRLLALLLGTRYRCLVTLKRIRVILFAFWLLICLGSVMRIWFLSLMPYIVCPIITINLVVSGFCYTKIYFALRHHQVQVMDSLYQRHQKRTIPMNILSYKKTVCNALYVHVALIACYLPYSIVMFTWINGESYPFLHVADAFATSLIFFNSSLNPVLYCLRIKEVKQAVKETIRKFSC